MVDEFAGSVPGPVSHVTLCEFDAFDHVNVTCPAATVSGVGLKELLVTVMLVLCPPVLLPVELLHAATNAAPIATATIIRPNRITPPGFPSRRTNALLVHHVPKTGRDLVVWRDGASAARAPVRRRRGEAR